MRTNFTFALKASCLAVVASFTGYFSFAQVCTSPKLSFKNPTLYSGVAKQEGAKYKFANVTPGVDAIILLKKIKYGASLVCMDTTNMGYDDAWQPIIDGPTGPVGNKSFIDFEITFQTTAGSSYTYPCLDLSAIDIDGDNVKIREFVTSKDYSSYNTPAGTLMSLLSDSQNGNQGDNEDPSSPGTEGKGPVANRLDIDTTALDVRVNFKYNNKNKIRVTLGAYVDNSNPAASATARYSSLYFKTVSNVISAPLPVTYTSFNAAVNNKTVLLNWITSHEYNSSHFEVERSFDKTSFTTLGLVLDANMVKGDDRTYGFKDNATELQSNSVAYYRLKQVDIDGNFTYSTIIAVRLQAKSGIQMQTSPNPFTEKINVSLSATENTNAEIRLVNLTGQSVISRKLTVTKGFNNIVIDGLGALNSGIYIGQVLMNGVVVDNQKIIKE